MKKVKLSKEVIKKLKNIKEFKVKDISLKDIRIEPGKISLLKVPKIISDRIYNLGLGKGEGGVEGEGKIPRGYKKLIRPATEEERSRGFSPVIETYVKDIPLGSLIPCACGCGKFILLKKRTHRFFDGACRIRYWRNKRRIVVAGPSKPGEIVRRPYRKVEGYIKGKKA